MKRAGRIIKTIVIEGLLVLSVLLVLLMVVDLYHPAQPNTYKAHGGEVVIPELIGLSPDSLLNSGDAAALDKLPGIGEVLAERIIETRERDGLYFFPEDLMSVSGIGEKKYADIMAYLLETEATPTDLLRIP